MTKKATISIFDDNKDILGLLETIFSKRGYKVYTYDAFENIVELVQETMPDIIIMDHQMPGITGIEAIELLKGNPQTEKVPVIYYSSADDIVQLSQKAGAAAYLPKPSSTEIIIKTIEKVLRG